MTWREETYTITCDQSGTQHAITVSTPFRYDSMETAPLIVCLDGAWTAGTVRDASRIMSMSGESPEVIVVGIAFTDTTMGDYLRSRARWFTPTPWVPPVETGVKNVDAADMGRAAVYLDVIRDQVLPRVEADYRVSERWLHGHSFSALFGLRVLFTEPELFSKYLLASPSIWWDDRAILELEAAYAAEHQDLRAKVFVTAGEHEGGEAFDDTVFRMRTNVVELYQTLQGRNYPNLELAHAILPNETHSSTVGHAISAGLRTLL